MSIIKPEKLPWIHCGLSPRGAPGVYRHSIRTRIWPKTWSKDTQSATSGTLIIHTPRDESCDLRQELWSYHGENRGASQSDLYRLPQIPFRSSFELNDDGKFNIAGLSFTRETSLPVIRMSTEESPRQICHQGQQQQPPINVTQAINSVERENAPVRSAQSQKNNVGISVLSKRNHNEIVKATIASRRNLKGGLHQSWFHVPPVIQCTGTIRRFKSEESLPTDFVKIRKWKSERNINVPHKDRTPESKTLIAIVGKLPTVRRGMLKTLQTLQKEKYCDPGHVGAGKADVSSGNTAEMSEKERVIEDHSQKTGVDPANNPIAEKDPGNADKNLERNSVMVGTKPIGLEIKLLRGQPIKLNPPKTRVCRKGIPNTETKEENASGSKKPSTKAGDNLQNKDSDEGTKPEKREIMNTERSRHPKESLDELADHVSWVQQAMERNAIIDSEGYQDFAHRKSPVKSVKKSSDKGDNNSVATSHSTNNAR